MKILPEVFVLLYKNNPYEAYDDVNQTRKNEFINNPELFEKKARYFTKKYANPCAIYKKNYPDGWDFTYKEWKRFNFEKNNYLTFIHIFIKNFFISEF